MRVLAIPILLWIAVLPLIASAIEVSGDVWGTWSPVNNPYEVVGELRVPPESTLVIEPGVFVDFQGHYKFIVDSLATLLAIGTETDSIYFTTDDTATGWHGIRFFYADGGCQISYSHLEYGKAGGSWPDYYGGGIFCYYSSPAIGHNNIMNNCAGYGGGICCYSSSDATIADNIIHGNSGGSGGGIYCADSNPAISDNTISANSATEWGGGGICCWLSSPTICDNTISANSATLYGGAIYCRSSDPTISNNTISDNTADADAGGIYCYESSPTITNNIINGNSAALWGGGGIYCRIASSPTISANTINGNSAGAGGGIACGEESHPTISGNTITGNSANYTGGGIYCANYSSPTISDNTIGSNSASWDGGGISCSYSSPIISSNTISDNSVIRGDGGGICCDHSSCPRIEYDVISCNSARNGGGISCCGDSEPGIMRSTITRNSASYGGGFYFDRSQGSIINVILWADSAAEGHEIFILAGNPTVTYCDVQGGWVGQGNIDADPLFVDPEHGDFHLLPGSPCIDAGDPNSPPDPDGTRADMGAFYFDQTPVIEIPTQELPQWFYLSQNFPNPFNVSTEINYHLPIASYVRLEIFNALGERVAILMEGERKRANRSVIWDASNFSSGIYFYRLTAGEYTFTRKMVLSK